LKGSLKIMRKTAVAILLSGAAVAAMASGTAPVNAYPGGCETDAFGRCIFAPFDPNAVEDSPADLEAFGTTPDQEFAYWLTHDDDVPNFRIMDFNIVKSQALRVCQQVASGMDWFDAAEDLRNFGGHTEDQAYVVASWARIIYCP
jgi:hypothetical protein